MTTQPPASESIAREAAELIRAPFTAITDPDRRARLRRELDRIESIIAAALAKHTAALQAENDRLRGELGRLLGTARTYIDADPIVKGEAFRDFQETVRWIEGERDDLIGWPAVYERQKAELADLRRRVGEAGK